MSTAEMFPNFAMQEFFFYKSNYLRVTLWPSVSKTLIKLGEKADQNVHLVIRFTRARYTLGKTGHKTVKKKDPLKLQVLW